MNVTALLADIRDLNLCGPWDRAGRGARIAAVADTLERRYGVGARLAVYGSLAPGRENHHVVKDLGGTWTGGLFVRGRLESAGWGAGLGYPALHWAEDGDRVAVQLLLAEGLRGAWGRLDEFEGPDYRRLLVPVYDAAGALATIANLYAARLAG